MKLKTHKSLFLMLALLLALGAGPLSAEVYKTVDEDGNVVYTDKPPGNGVKPMDLPELSVVEKPEYEKTARELAAEKAAEDQAAGIAPEPKEIPLKQLRRDFSDFAIISPQQEESIWRPDGPVTIAWSTGEQMLAGMKVTVTLDGKRIGTTSESMILVPNMDRGEHTVSAELTDAKNHRVALAEPVTFFIRQPGLSNRVRVAPNGGG